MLQLRPPVPFREATSGNVHEYAVTYPTIALRGKEGAYVAPISPCSRLYCSPVVLATAPPIRLPALAAMPTLKWHHVSAFAVYVFLLGWALHAFPRLRTWLRYFITGPLPFHLAF